MLVGFQLDDDVQAMVTVPLEAHVHELRSAETEPSIAMLAVPVVHGEPDAEAKVHEKACAVQEDAEQAAFTGKVKKSSRVHVVTVVELTSVRLGGVCRVKSPFLQSYSVN